MYYGQHFIVKFYQVISNFMDFVSIREINTVFIAVSIGIISYISNISMIFSSAILIIKSKKVILLSELYINCHLLFLPIIFYSKKGEKLFIKQNVGLAISTCRKCRKLLILTKGPEWNNAAFEVKKRKRKILPFYTQGSTNSHSHLN